MQLLTAELRAQLPPLYSQETNKDPQVHLLCPAEHKQTYVLATVMCFESTQALRMGGHAADESA